MSDFRALCQELVDELHAYKVANQQHDDALLARARAALAAPAPVVVAPSDEEIMGLMPSQMHEDLAAAARALAEQAGRRSRRAKGMMRIILNRHAVDLARAVLARFGGTTPAPVPVPCDEERAELAAWLRLKGQGAWPCPDGFSAAAQAEEYEFMSRLTRAADLLERGATPAPVPVPVGERLPGAEDCDAEGLCWVWNFTAYTWGLFRLDLTAHSHWLPASALPLPEVAPYLPSEGGYETGTMWTGHGVRSLPEVAP